MTKRAPWDRKPQEAPAAFEMFAHYRDQGPQRSLARVRQAFGKKPSYLRQIQRWSSTHRWVERATAWDDEQDRLAREATAKAKDAMRARQLKYAAEFQDALRVPAQVFLERLAREDKDTVNALNNMPAEDLLKLVALSARASKAAVAVEMAASGEDASSLQDEADQAALDQLADALEAAAKTRGVSQRPRKPAA